MEIRKVSRHNLALKDMQTAWCGNINTVILAMLGKLSICYTAMAPSMLALVTLNVLVCAARTASSNPILIINKYWSRKQLGNASERSACI